MDDFARKWGFTIFNFGLGFMLVNTLEMPNWSMWLITGFTVTLGLLAILQFGQIASFWTIANKQPADFGPNGEHHDMGKVMFDRSVMVAHDFQSKEKFWLSVGCSILVMAGFLRHGWHVALAFEFIASVMGYSVIRAFLTNFPYYYSLIKGKELSNEQV